MQWVINERRNCRENIPIQFITKIIILLSFLSTSFLLTFCSREELNQKFSGSESIKHQSFKISEKRKKSDQRKKKKIA